MTRGRPQPQFDPEQLFLTPPDPAPQRSVDLTSRNAFGRVIFAEYLGIEAKSIANEISIEDLSLADTATIQKGLFVEGPDDPEKFVYRGVAFDPAEYITLVRSPKTLGATAMAHTLRARAPGANDREEAAGRSAEHAFEAKALRLTRLKSGIENETAASLRLKKEMSNPGYSHMSEAQMRILAQTVISGSFEQMVQVAGHSHGWSREEQKLAKLAMNFRLVGGRYSGRMDYWHDLTGLSINYSRARGALVKQNYRDVTNAITRLRLNVPIQSTT